MGKKSAFSRTIIIKFSLTRNKTLAVMVGVLLCILAVDLGSEQLTLTTYYPAPYGVYSKMRVTEYIEAGVKERQIRIGDIHDLTGNAGDAGIYAKAGSARNLTMGASGDAELKPDKDLVLYPGGDLVLGPGIYFKDMCEWIKYDTGTGKQTYCGGGDYNRVPVQGWSVVATGFRAGGGHPEGRTTAIPLSDLFLHGGGGVIEPGMSDLLVNIMPDEGVMLCCKLENY